MSAELFRRDAVATFARRGLRAYFEEPSAYMALLSFFLVTGYVFCLPLFLVGQASIRGLMDFVPLLMTFLVPALTMGLVADELKTGTFECLATLPLEDQDIVLGKFLGFAQLHALAVAGLAFFPLVLTFLVQPPAGLDWGETAGVLTALFCLGLAYGAIGLFASCLGESQVGAFMTAFLICFFFFAAGKFAPFFPGALASLLESAGIDAHAGALAKGVFDTRDLLYFATLTVAFLAAAVARLRARFFSGVGLALALSLLGSLDVAAHYVYARFDLSAGGAYSISTGTRSVLGRVKDDLLIRVYFTPHLPAPYSLTEQYLRDLLAEYRSAGRGLVRV